MATNSVTSSKSLAFSVKDFCKAFKINIIFLTHIYKFEQKLIDVKKVNNELKLLERK